MASLVEFLIASEKILKVESSGETSLDLSDSNLTSEELNILMPDILRIPNLTELILFRNYDITKLPDSICSLSNLTTLNLSNTGITDLPESIDQLSNLVTLQAFGTRIRELPDSIGNLGNLETLDLTGSRLERLPDSLSGLSSLTRLEVGNNRITEVPETLVNLPHIQILKFQSNPLSTDALSLLNHIALREGVTVRTNLAAFDSIQSDRDVLKIFYPDDQERALMTDRLEACDLDPVTITDGGRDQILISAKDAIKLFLGKIPVDSESDRNLYGSTAKTLFNRILDPNTSREEANTIVAEISISLGDCATPVKSYLEQKKIGELIKEGNELSNQDSLTIERLALVEKAGNLPGLQFDDRIEEVNGLVNLVFSKEKVDQAHIAMERVLPNIVFVGGIERDLPPTSSYPIICFSQIKDNPELIEQFANLICETNDNRLVQTANGEYILDEVKIKKIKDNYLYGKGVVTGDELVRNQHTSKYQEEMKKFMQTEDMADLVYTEHLTEANERDLADLPKQEKELKMLLADKTGKENIEQEYQRYVSEKKSSLLDFKKDMAQKDRMSEFTTPTITRKRPRSESPERDQEGQKESKVQHVSQRRF